MTIWRAVYGSLLGEAVGDAYGLPFEGLSPRRIAKYSIKPTFRLIPWINGGMVSDDTEHAIMTAQAFIASGGVPERFEFALKWRLMVWLLCLPAGVGLATGRSIFKMYLGLKRTGVYSAGNGVAMRSAILGVMCQDIDELKALVKISTELTHTDPKAYQGALLIALLAWVEYYQSTWDTDTALAWAIQQLDGNTPDGKLLIQKLSTHQADPKKGITGYIYDTIPMVVQTWQAYRTDPVAGFRHLVVCGGDTDSTCAIFGAVVGVRFGQQAFDSVAGRWCEPILTPKFFERLARQADRVVQHRQALSPVRFGGISTFLRNIIFLVIVLLHGFHRLLPPYG